MKQSPRAWLRRFTVAIKKFGYNHSHSDHTLFLKRKRKLITCIIIYVDDIIITGNDKEFEMKDLGRLKYFLGIEILISKWGIFISQRKYILDLLGKVGMLDCKLVETPMVVNYGLQTDKEGKQQIKNNIRNSWGN